MIVTRRLVLTGTAALGAFLTAPALAQTLHRDLQVLSALLGRWTGEGEGQPGRSTVERSYALVLGGRFIEARSRSTYAPQAANANGEMHDDLGYYSFERSSRRIHFRQFHTEGFVNTYAAPVPASLDAPFVMETIAIENIPPGFRARETLTLTGDRLEEVFEIAEPSADYQLYSRNRLARAG